MSANKELAALMADAPERIWLQVCDDAGCVESFAEHDGVTWCQHRINDTDIEYVRADRIAKPDGEPVAQRVRKVGGSFQHTGVVVARFKTVAGEERIVVEFDPPVGGMLHIYRPDQVEECDHD